MHQEGTCVTFFLFVFFVFVFVVRREKVCIKSDMPRL